MGCVVPLPDRLTGNVIVSAVIAVATTAMHNGRSMSVRLPRETCIDMTILALALSVAGGLCELAGLILVVIEIARDRDQARRLFRNRPRRLRRKRSYPSKALPRRYLGFPDQMSTRESQLRAILEHVAKIDAAAYNAFIDMRKALDTELDESVDRLQEEIAEADDELRGHLRYVLAGSISDRIKGALLLAVGIMLGTVGSVVGTLSHL